MACANTPNLQLQLLLQRNPQWRGEPLAVLSKESSYGTILQVNRKARRAGVLPGMRYASGLSYTSELRGGTVSVRELEQGLTVLTEALQRHSPGVEPCRSEPGLFWLDAEGLLPLYPSFECWAQKIRNELKIRGFFATVAVGATRFGTYAAAKTILSTVVFESETEESQMVQGAPLRILPLQPALLQRLDKLGIRSIGTFLRLPERGVRKRFGAEAQQLHRFASGARSIPLQALDNPVDRRIDKILPFAENDRTRLLWYIEDCQKLLLEGIRSQRVLVKELNYRFQGEEGSRWAECIRPATPTANGRILKELITLRLEAADMPEAVTSFSLSASCVQAINTQAELFQKQLSRNLKAGAQALARIRAALGEEAVVRAQAGPALLLPSRDPPS